MGAWTCKRMAKTVFSVQIVQTAFRSEHSLNTPGELVVAGGVPADDGEVGGVAVLRIGEDVKCVAEAPLDVTRAYPVHAAAASSGDGVVIFGGGVPCLSFAPVFGDCVRVVT